MEDETIHVQMPVTSVELLKVPHTEHDVLWSLLQAPLGESE